MRDLEDAAWHAARKYGQDADDVLQSTAEALLKAGHNLKTVDRPLVYVYARNAAIDIWRRESHSTPWDTTTDAQGNDGITRHTQMLPDSQTEVDLVMTLEAIVLPHMGALEGTQRDVAVAYYLDGLEGPEIAQRLGLTPANVRYHLSKVRKTLGEHEGDLAIYRGWAHPGAHKPLRRPQASEALGAVFS